MDHRCRSGRYDVSRGVGQVAYGRVRTPLRSGRVTLQDMTGRWDVERDEGRRQCHRAARRNSAERRAECRGQTPCVWTPRLELSQPQNIAHEMTKERNKRCQNGYLVAGISPRRRRPWSHCRIVALSHSPFPQQFVPACPCFQQQIALMARTRARTLAGATPAQSSSRISARRPQAALVPIPHRS